MPYSKACPSFFLYIQSEDIHIFEFPALKKYEGRYIKYLQNSKSYYNRKKLLEVLGECFNWYISYCGQIINSKTYSPKLVIECVLREHIKSENHFREYLAKSIYIAKDYIKYLQTSINVGNIETFRNAITELKIDLEWLIVNYEVKVRKSIEKATLSSGRYPFLRIRDLYWAANSMFRIETLKNVNDLYLRDIKPVVVFQIRQLLELYGRQVIGYETIMDKNGRPSKKFSQVAWAFIEEEIKRKYARISFPFDVHSIAAINSWSNGFVHTAYIYSSFVQHFVLEYLKVLFTGPKMRVKTVVEQKTTNAVADIRIIHYNLLKRDFENYLESKMSGTRVEWLPLNQMAAYVISL